ncbi:Ig-like domain-containing protein, partial [Mycolicibacterium sp.]|uniref:Ig-like domain-containing protein n=1 Tax=Mycolicibacterium sp. TaxID=2320850 RepID=UPI003D10E024
MASCTLPARPPRAGYARAIGRVGVLAVTLGIGVAVATSPGTAWATTDSESSGTTGTTSQEGPDDTGDGSPVTEDARGTGDEPPDTGDGDGDGDEPSPTSGDEDSVDAGDDPAPAPGSASADPDTEPATTAPEPDPAPAPSSDVSGGEPAAVPEPRDAGTGHPDGPTPPAKRTEDAAPVVSAPAVTEAPESAVPTAAAVAQRSALLTSDAVSVAATPSTAVVAPSPIPPRQVQPKIHPIVALVRPIVSLALGLFGLSGSPQVPAEPPLGWALLAWVRRHIEHTLFNDSPLFNLGTVTTSQADDGVIVGTVAATDPDDDPLSYRVVAGPAHGQVTIDPLTGRFTYTPDGDLGSVGGTDTFTVAASERDSATQWHGPIRGILSALFCLDRGDNTLTVVATATADADDRVVATVNLSSVPGFGAPRAVAVSSD